MSKTLDTPRKRLLRELRQAGFGDPSPTGRGVKQWLRDQNKQLRVGSRVLTSRTPVAEIEAELWRTQ
jgi:hypothetical protein